MPRDPSVAGSGAFVRCSGCGTFGSVWRRSSGELAALTDSDAYQGGESGLGAIYADYAADESQRLVEARARARRSPLAGFGSAHRVFEIGCGSGSVLAALAERRVEVFGCDLSGRFAEIGARRHGLTIQVGDYLALPPLRPPYDAVLMLGTASNLDALPEVLGKVRSELASAGRLILNFPAADGWVSRLYGNKHWMFAPSVAQFPTRAGMRRCLAAAGFEIETLAHDRQAPSLGKLLRHSRLDRFAPRSWLTTGIGLPIALPIPSVFEVVARRA